MIGGAGVISMKSKSSRARGATKRPGSARPPHMRVAGLFTELADLRRQTRDLAARGLLMNHAALSGAHELRFGGLEGGQSFRRVTARDRFLDRAHPAAHARAARPVYRGAADDLAGRA